MAELLKHVHWLLSNRGESIERALKKKRVNLSLQEALLVFQEADPSPKKIAVQWLTESFVAGGYRWEDIKAGSESKVAHTLTLFHKFKNNLVGDKRKLSNYINLSDVYRAVEKWAVVSDDQSNKEVKRHEKQAAMDESLIIYKDKELIVSVPQTLKASQWWGKGTQWCTAANKDNYFHAYHCAAPLIIFTFPQGLQLEAKETSWHEYDTWRPDPNLYWNEPVWRKKSLEEEGRTIYKLQLHLDEKLGSSDVQSEEYEISFMDETDSEVSSDLIDQHWDVLSPIVQWIVSKVGKNLDWQQYHRLSWYNDSQWTSTIWDKFTKAQKQLISDTNSNIRFKPNSNKPNSTAIQNKVVNPESFTCSDIIGVPRTNTDIGAIKLSSMNVAGILGKPAPHKDLAIQELMKKYNSIKFWKEVAEHDPELFYLYPSSIKVGVSKKLDVKLFGINNEPNPQEKKWIKFLMEYEDDDSNRSSKNSVLGWIPYEERTYLLCQTAILLGKGWLHHVPNHLITLELCKMAIKSKACSMADIPHGFRNTTMLVLAQNNAILDLRFFPEQEITLDLIKALLSNEIEKLQAMDGQTNVNLRFIRHTVDKDKRWIDQEIADTIVEHFTTSIHSVPNGMIRDEALIKALVKRPDLIDKVPEELLTENLLVKVVLGNRKTIDYISGFEATMEKYKELFYWKEEDFFDLRQLLENSRNSRNNLSDKNNESIVP